MLWGLPLSEAGAALTPSPTLDKAPRASTYPGSVLPSVLFNTRGHMYHYHHVTGESKQDSELIIKPESGSLGGDNGSPATTWSLRVPYLVQTPKAEPWPRQQPHPPTQGQIPLATAAAGRIRNSPSELLIHS